MSWYVGNQPVKSFRDFNYELEKIKGDFSDEQGKVLLAKFLKTNLGFTLNLFTGFEALPLQEIILKGILLSDLSLIIAGRGGSKTTLISILSIIYPIFNPGTKMCLISSNFRNARRILEASEKLINNKNAALMHQCFPNAMRRGNDIFQWRLDNGSEVFALPLASNSGEGLRGTRASYCCVDEGLLISKEIQESVIKPFLTVKQDPAGEWKIKELEDDLIKRGVMEEKDRISFPKNKYSVFSSASYQFEYLYEMYKNYCQQIEKPAPLEHGDSPPKYFVIRYSYEALPKNSLMDLTQINAAKSAMGENSEIFKREYRAIFSDSSDSYFNIKRMIDCTYKGNGDGPTTQIKGSAGKRYILAIDPSYSSSKNSDFFAMGVFEIDEENRKICLVHSYGRAGGQLVEHFQYLLYVLTFFNIVFVCIDGSGTEFISGFNESSLAKERNIHLEFFTEKLDAEDPQEYIKELSKAKLSYNLTNRRFVWAQNFAGRTRMMNENMQNMIDSARLWFAGPISGNEVEIKKAMQVVLPFIFKDAKDRELNQIDFVESQDFWIRESISQISRVEVTASSSGHLLYDLPRNLRQMNGENKIRKDNYTTTMLGCLASKYYFDLFFTSAVEPEQEFATPIIIR